MEMPTMPAPNRTNAAGSGVTNRAKVDAQRTVCSQPYNCTRGANLHLLKHCVLSHLHAFITVCLELLRKTLHRYETSFRSGSLFLNGTLAECSSTAMDCDGFGRQREERLEVLTSSSARGTRRGHCAPTGVEPFSQCAPTAQITSGGRTRPDRCWLGLVANEH